MKHHSPRLILFLPPTMEPLSLEEVKAYLRITDSRQDNLVDIMIKAAREHAELYTRRSLMAREWKLVYSDYAPTRVFLPRGPIRSFAFVRIEDESGATTNLSTDEYYLSPSSDEIILKTSPRGHAVEFRYVGGYGGASSVPGAIRQGMLMHIAQMYESEGVDHGMSTAIRNLYDMYRVVTL